MRGRPLVRTLRRIAEVRDLQRRASEARFASAIARAGRLDALRIQALEQLSARESEWTSALTGATIDLALSSAYGSAVVMAEQNASEAGVRHRQAETARANDGVALHMAMAHADLAAQRSRAAARKVDRRREESALADAADQSTRKATVR